MRLPEGDVDEEVWGCERGGVEVGYEGGEGVLLRAGERDAVGDLFGKRWP